MSWKDEEIDHLFKSNSEKLSFEYKDAYWKEMEAMLPKKKNRDFLWFFTASSFAGLILMGMFYSPAGISNQTQLAENNLTNSRISSVVASQDLGEMNSHSSPDSDGSQDVQQSIDLKEEQSSEFSMNDSKAGKIKSSGPDVVLHFTSKRTLPKESNKRIDQIPNAIFLSQKETESISSKGNQPKLAQNISEKLAGVSRTQLEKETNLLESNHADNGTSDEKLESVDVENLPLRDVAQFSTERNLDIIPIQAVKKVVPLQTRFYVEAIGGITQSLVTPSDKIGSSYGLGLGVQLTKNRWNFTFGVNGLVGNYNDIQLTRIAKYYSFGSTEVRHNLDYHNLYSVEGNFSAGFMLGRHELSLGIRPSFVASSKVDYSRDFEGDKTEQKAYIGYMEGVNRFGLKPTLGYTYHFKKGWQLGLRGGVQLFDSFKSEYIQKENAKFPIDGQLFLRKTFNFKRK